MSFTRAAEAMDTTQSAVSLKIKRLEAGLGRRLLERTPRLVRLSAEGERLSRGGAQPRRGTSVRARRLCHRTASPLSSESAITSSALNSLSCSGA